MCGENSTRRHLESKFEAHFGADRQFENHDIASNVIAADFVIFDDVAAIAAAAVFC